MSWLYIIAAVLVIGGGLFYGAYRLISWQSLGGLLSDIIKASWPGILKAIRPRNLTEEQRRIEREGGDYAKNNTPGTGK